MASATEAKYALGGSLTIRRRIYRCLASTSPKDAYSVSLISWRAGASTANDGDGGGENAEGEGVRECECEREPDAWKPADTGDVGCKKDDWEFDGE